MALARSIAPRPGVLLMDEPFSNLDRRMRDAIRDETVAILRETGATTIVVTHDPEEAMRIADRIVLMRAGRIMQAGHGRGDLPPPGRPLRGALLLRLQRGRGRGPRRAGRDAGRALSRRRRWRTGRRNRLHPAAGGAAQARRLLPAGARAVAPLPRRGRSCPGRRPGLDRPLQARVRGPACVNDGRGCRASRSTRTRSLFSPQVDP